MAAFEANLRILIIGDNESFGVDLRAVLARGRSACGAALEALPELSIDTAHHGEHGLELVQAAKQDERPYSLAFVDVQLPPIGCGVETTRALLTADDELQIVFCTAGVDGLFEADLCQLAATGRVMLLTRPFETAAAWLLTTSLADKWRVTHDMNGRLQHQAEQLANTRRMMSIFEGCLEELEHTHEELRSHAAVLTQRLEQRQAEIAGTRDLTMFALAQLADSRDPETGEHLRRMRAYAQLLAEHLSEHGPYVCDIDRDFLAEFYRSTPLHDIGKVGILDQILLKPGPLSREEFEIMKRHTVIGAEALEKAARQSSFGDFLNMAAVIARSHHEQFDGTGYPDGLSGEAIPLCARITAVADIFDALTSARVYKDAMPCDEAREFILCQSERHFDPVVVEAFVACYDKFLKVKASVDEGQVVPGSPVDCLPLPLIEPERMLETGPLLEYATPLAAV
ncbi:MAG: HD domain-containing phosphohydrolase [Planctomycetota bacterium]